MQTATAQQPQKQTFRFFGSRCPSMHIHRTAQPTNLRGKKKPSQHNSNTEMRSPFQLNILGSSAALTIPFSFLAATCAASNHASALCARAKANNDEIGVRSTIMKRSEETEQPTLMLYTKQTQQTMTHDSHLIEEALLDRRVNPCPM